MVAIPLAHVSWAIADNANRKTCDDFFIDVFGAETAYEILITPETEKMGLDREEKLLMVGDTMIIPIAPAGAGVTPESPLGEMLRRSARPGRWLGLALKAADLKAADAWLSAKGFKLHYDRGMEEHYFLISRGQVLGVRIEIIKQDLPNDPRMLAGWTPAKWRDEHPLGIEGLQSVGVSVPSLDAARDIFGAKFEWPEIGTRALPGDEAECAAFAMGDTVIEAMAGTSEASPVTQHCRDIQGVYCLTFKVKSAEAAADYLRGKGLTLVGDTAGRFAITPDQAYDRLIYFTEQALPGYPPLGSKMREPAQFPMAGAV